MKLLFYNLFKLLLIRNSQEYFKINKYRPMSLNIYIYIYIDVHCLLLIGTTLIRRLWPKQTGFDNGHFPIDK